MSSDQLKKFTLLVQEMRDAQKAYFRTRNPTHLEMSKQLEKQVDRMVREILDDQSKLFPT